LFRSPDGGGGRGSLAHWRFADRERLAARRIIFDKRHDRLDANYGLGSRPWPARATQESTSPRRRRKGAAHLELARGCRRIVVSDQTFFRWRVRYGALKDDEAQRLRQLELENSRLKRIVAEKERPDGKRTCSW
jgi:hypothetical protein